MYSQRQQISALSRELDRARLQAATEQIDPHYLGNTLSVIHHLCLTRPADAAQATELLASHMGALRDATATSSCIPMATELAHVRDYLQLRSLALAGRLRYEIDQEADGFDVPPLCVLTLVENAVEHGIGPARGGSVSVRIWDEDGCHLVRVSDDGVGFEPHAEPAAGASPQGGRAHLGLANTRLRVESLCHGTLSVQSAPGEGTVATICLPIAPGCQSATRKAGRHQADRHEHSTHNA